MSVLPWALFGPRQIFSTAHARSRQTALPRPCGGAGERVDQQRRGNGCSVRQRHRTCNFDRRDLGATGYSNQYDEEQKGKRSPFWIDSLKPKLRHRYRVPKSLAAAASLQVTESVAPEISL